MDEIDMTSEVWQKSCSKQEGRRTSRLSALWWWKAGSSAARVERGCCIDGVGSEGSNFLGTGFSE